MDSDQPQTPIKFGPVAMFVDRPVLSLMLSVAVIAIGVIALFKLPLQLVPDGMSGDTINLYVPVRNNMPPREVEERVLKPLESLLRTIPGVKQLKGNADSDSAYCGITLESGQDPVLASAEVRDRVQRARLEWPDDVDRYFTWREDPSSAPLAFFQIQIPENSTAWDVKLDEIVSPRLEAVDGVGRVELWGLIDETLRIWFDRDKLIEHRVDYGALIGRLMGDNFTEPVGELDDGHSRYLVRVDTKFHHAEDIENFPVKTGLKISDIARVERVPSVRDSLARFDEKFTKTGMLRLSSGANPVDTSRALRAAMEELKADPRLTGIGFRFMFDQGEMIEDSLSTLLTTSIQGGMLALIALFLFLRNLRLTLVVAAAIPMALMIAAGYLFFGGSSLNILTMAGMTLAVGMVVDNSVVVLENVRRRRGEGWDLRRACITGTREMALAVTMATLTTVVVILPLVFMGSDDNIRASLTALGMPLSIALLGSLAVALLLLPAAARRVGTGALHPQGHLGALTRLSPVQALVSINQRTLGMILRSGWHRLAALILAGLTIWSIAIPLDTLELGIGDGDHGPFRGGDVRMNFEVPRGRTLGDVLDEVEGFEAFLFANQERWQIEHVSVRFDRTSIRFDLIFEEDVAKTAHKELRREILAEFPRRPGIRPTLRNAGRRGMGAGGGEEEDSNNFVLRIWGADSEYLAAKALEVRDRLLKLPQVASVEIGDGEDNEQVVVAVNRERANELGVRPESLERATAAGLRGIELTRFEETGREIRLLAQFDSERNPTLWDLKDTQIWSDDGTFRRLDDLAEIRFEKALTEIRRIDSKTHITMVGERAEGVTSRDMSAALTGLMTSTSLPRGYSWSEESPGNEIQAQLQELLSASLLSIVLVFLLMGILFESVILPGAILATIPFALFGAFWSLRLFHGSIDIMAGIGMLLLCGIVVNNGIVLLDAIERLRRQGMPRDQAIVEGSRIRLRPIVMTAVTTVFGLLPMAVFGESTGEGISYVGMSIAVAGGLTVSTLCTALSVPLLYTYLDDLSGWLRRVRAGVLGASQPKPQRSPKPQSL